MPKNESWIIRDLRKWLPRDDHAVEHIDLAQSGFTDSKMPLLAGMSRLKILKLKLHTVGIRDWCNCESCIIWNVSGSIAPE